MSPEQERKLDDVSTAITEIRSAIIGSEYGTEGILPRLEKVEKYQQDDEKFKNRVAGGVAVGVPVFTVIWNFIYRKISGA